MSNYINYIVKDKWIWMWLFLLLVTWFWASSSIKAREIVRQDVELVSVNCFAWSRYEEKWEMTVMTKGEEMTIQIPKDRCNKISKSIGSNEKISVIYSKIGNYRYLLNLFHNDEPFYNAELIDDRYAGSTSLVRFYWFPLMLILWRLINIFVGMSRE